MAIFDEGSNFISIENESGRAFSFACFEDGNHEMQFGEARFTGGIGADAEEWKKFFERCLELIEKFR